MENTKLNSVLTDVIHCYCQDLSNIPISFHYFLYQFGLVEHLRVHSTSIRIENS